MPAASLHLEIMQGGPFDGLPALSLRFESAACELDLAPLEIIRTLRHPPTILRILVVDGALDSRDDIIALMQYCSSIGMAILVETFEAVLPWMLLPLVARRTLHTEGERVTSPVEEIVFHTEELPLWRPLPFHVARPPVLWWDPLESPNALFTKLPSNWRLWQPRKRVEEILYGEEEA